MENNKLYLKAEVGARPFEWVLHCFLVGLVRSRGSSGECRNSCWAAAGAPVGIEGIDPGKEGRGRGYGPADPTEMRRRCRDWNECDRRDCVLSDHARRVTDRSSLALARRQNHPVGYAMAPARIADLNRSGLGSSSLN